MITDLVSDDTADVKPVPLPHNKLEQTRLLFGLRNPFRPLALIAFYCAAYHRTKLLEIRSTYTFHSSTIQR